MAINTITDSNTFKDWLSVTQQLISSTNDLTGSGANTSFTSNTELRLIRPGVSLNVANNILCRGNLTVTGSGVALTVSNNATITGNLLVSRAATLSNVSIKTAGVSTGETGVLSLYTTQTTSTATKRTADIVAGFTGVWGSEYLAFNVGNNAVQNDAGLLTKEKVRLDANGNLCIGATSTSYKLDVRGTANISSSLYLGGGISTSANGFGTSGQVLVSDGATKVYWRSIQLQPVISSDDSSANFLQYPLFTSQSIGVGTVLTSANIASSRMVFNAATGQLGLNTFNPTASLHVVGTANVTSTLAVGSTCTVGGTLTAAALTVPGTFTLTGALSANNGIGTSGQILTSNGTNAFWTSPVYTTISNDAGSLINQNRFLLFSPSSSGSLTVANVATTALVYNPNTNAFGIGTAAPSSTLHVVGSANISSNLIVNTVVAGGTVGSSQQFLMSNGPGTPVSWGVPSVASGTTIGTDTSTATAKYIMFSSQTSGNVTQTNVSTAMTFVPSTGSIGLGKTPSASYKLDIAGAANCGTLSVSVLSLSTGVGTTGQLLSSTGSGLAWVDKTSVGNSATFTTLTGEQFVSFTSQATGQLTIVGVASAFKYNTTSQVLTVPVLSTSSDKKLKTNIRTIDHALEKIQHMRGVEFIRKQTNQKDYGVIAQELEEVLPEAVHGKDGQKSVSYTSIIGVLIEAIKALQTEIEELQQRG